jgi:hypothetical protein
MKTRIIVATAIAACFSTAALAQKMTYDAGRITYGVRVGVNFNTITGKDASGNKFDNNINTGFHVGVNAEVPVGSGSYIQPGVLYSQKGAEFKDNNEVKLTYIEVPVNFIYKPILGAGRMLLGFGPYVGFGLGGKVKSNDGKETDVEFTKNYDAGVNKPQYKGIDGGANFLAGYELKNNLSFQINAQLGLTQLTPGIDGEDNPIKQKNTNFGVSVGYRF